jgi:hypothetical protein
MRPVFGSGYWNVSGAVIVLCLYLFSFFGCTGGFMGLLRQVLCLLSLVPTCPFFCFWFCFIFFGGIGVWTLAVDFANLVLYCLSCTSSPFCSGCFEDGISRSICLICPWTVLLLISSSQVVRIIGVSHPLPALLVIFENGFHLKHCLAWTKTLSFLYFSRWLGWQACTTYCTQTLIEMSWELFAQDGLKPWSLSPK